MDKLVKYRVLIKAYPNDLIVYEANYLADAQEALKHYKKAYIEKVQKKETSRYMRNNSPI